MQSIGGVVFTLLFLGALVFGVISAQAWPPRASIDVYFVATVGITLAVLQLTLDAVRYFRNPGSIDAPITGSKLTRYYFEAAGWIAAILALVFLIGFHIAFFIVPIAYARVYGGSWRLALTLGGMALAILIGLFDTVISVVWPPPLLLPDLYNWVDSVLQMLG